MHIHMLAVLFNSTIKTELEEGTETWLKNLKEWEIEKQTKSEKLLDKRALHKPSLAL